LDLGVIQIGVRQAGHEVTFDRGRDGLLVFPTGNCKRL